MNELDDDDEGSLTLGASGQSFLKKHKKTKNKKNKKKQASGRKKRIARKYQVKATLGGACSALMPPPPRP